MGQVISAADQQQQLEETREDPGFVRMLTSYNPQHNPTFIDEGNHELFVIEQKSGDGHVDQIHLTPNQAFEMREKLNAFLSKHFGEITNVSVGDRQFIVVRRQDLTKAA